MAKLSCQVYRSQVLVLLCASAMAFAADPPGSAPDANPSGQRIVITGQRPSADEPTLESRISKFVQAHATKTDIDQYARWRAPVCPQTIGLDSADAAAFVSGRIKEIAATASAPVDAPCELNITVVFAAEPQKLLNYVSEHQSSLLGYHHVSQRAQLATVKYPVQAWYATATRGNSGYGRPRLDVSGQPVPSGGEASKSRLTGGVASEFAHVLVVVDANKFEGKPLAPLADYVAMLALSHPDPATQCGDLPSILDLLSPSCRGGQTPASVTEADTAYLKALYSMDLRALGKLQRSQMSALMRQELTK
jgi:hypothetical protein